LIQRFVKEVNGMLLDVSVSNGGAHGFWLM
jgi:hypothetical protein